MVPTYGAVPRVGAVPHAWAVPADKMPPFVLDISSSAVAANKIQLLRRTGAQLLPGLLADEKGTPIMEEQDVPAETRLLPWGSTRELGSHKGYGMAVIGQVFSGILSAGLFGVSNPPGNGSQFVAAFSIDAFRDVSEFKQSLDEFLWSKRRRRRGTTMCTTRDYPSTRRRWSGSGTAYRCTAKLSSGSTARPMN